MKYGVLKPGDVIRYRDALLLVLGVRVLAGEDFGYHTVRWLNLDTGEVCQDNRIRMSDELRGWELFS